MAEIRLPNEGISDRPPFRKTPPAVAPPGTTYNVVLRRSTSGRMQFTKRPGWRKLFKTRFGQGRVQGIDTLARASAITSATVGDTAAITDQNGTSRRSVLADANFWMMPLASDGSRGLRDTAKIFGSTGHARVLPGSLADYAQIAGIANFPNSPVPWAVAIHPSAQLAAVLVNYTDTTAKTFIAFFDFASGSFICAKNLAGADVAATAVVWTEKALWIAKGNLLHYVVTPFADGEASILNVASTTVSQAAGSLSGALAAAGSITGMCQYKDGSGETFIYACFRGDPSAGTHANPAAAITAGAFAKHFRAGIYRLAEREPIPNTFDYEVQDFGGVIGLADPYSEVSGGTPVVHRTARFSAWLDRAPRGAYPTAVACNADGSVAVTITNQGYGPNSAWPPDGSNPYASVAKFDLTGTLMWEADVGSNISGEAGGKLASVATTYPTDIPNEDGGNAGTTSKNGPALRNIAMDAFGDVYVSGRINAGPGIVYAFQNASGQPKFNPVNLADVAQVPGAGGWSSAGIALANDSLFVVSTRNNLWDGASVSEPYASLWRLSPVDGTLEWSYSITQTAAGSPPDNDPTATCLAAAGDVLVFGSAIFTDA